MWFLSQKDSSGVYVSAIDSARGLAPARRSAPGFRPPLTSSLKLARGFGLAIGFIIVLGSTALANDEPLSTQPSTVSQPTQASMVETPLKESLSQSPSKESLPQAPSKESLAQTPPTEGSIEAQSSETASPPAEGGQVSTKLTETPGARQKTQQAQGGQETNDTTGGAANLNFSNLLCGHVMQTDLRYEFGRTVQQLVEKTLAQSPDFLLLQKQINKKPHLPRRVVHRVGQVVHEVLPLDTMASSKDGAKIVLDQTGDWDDDRDSLLFAEQKYIDEMHPRVADALLQLAMGVGMPQQNDHADHLINRGMKELDSLVGNDAARQTLDLLKRWRVDIDNNPTKQRHPRDLIAVRRHLKILVEAAVQDDATTNAIRQELRKLARPGKIKNATLSTIEAALDAVAYSSPGIGITAMAETLRGLIVVGSGGGEEDKMEHELQLLKRLASRRAALTEEIQLGLYGREIGVQAENKLLVACSEALITNLVSLERVRSVTSKYGLQKSVNGEREHG